MPDEVETDIWKYVQETLAQSETAPESDYRDGFQNALELVRGYIEDNYEIMEALED